MDKTVGVHKDIDKLGRIVIPKKMRTLLQLEDDVELVVTEEGILIRNPKYKLVKKTDPT